MGLPNVAYFSMEIAIDQSIATYSGGLGFLAGSHMQSAGYLQISIKSSIFMGKVILADTCLCLS